MSGPDGEAQRVQRPAAPQERPARSQGVALAGVDGQRDFRDRVRTGYATTQQQVLDVPAVHTGAAHGQLEPVEAWTEGKKHVAQGNGVVPVAPQVDVRGVQAVGRLERPAHRTLRRYVQQQERSDREDVLPRRQAHDSEQARHDEAEPAAHKAQRPPRGCAGDAQPQVIGKDIHAP